MRATQQSGAYPRPTMCRRHWFSLDGTWGFAHDDADDGLVGRWFEGSNVVPFARQIEVPYPPESPASGVGAREKHPIVWYRRTVPHDGLLAAGEDPGDGPRRVLVHFGAVDYRAQVWCDGQLVASHVGGQTPFTADVTDALAGETSQHVLVVRAEDDPEAVDQPRGKQDWLEKPHGIWYERTTGIWQPVWAESVAPDHVVDVVWAPDLSAGAVRGEITLSRTPARPLLVEVTLTLDDETLAAVSCRVSDRTAYVDIAVPASRNGQDRGRLVWTPENPVLVDSEIMIRDEESRRVLDSVTGYLGLRTVSVGGGRFELNGQPYYLRSVLNQGYREQTHLASHGSDELRVEVELIKSMGFNAVRVHQKAEDPRFLFWADRLGLLVWGETASPYEFSPTSISLLTPEWLSLVQRDRSHPSVAAWIPVNESWGVPDIATVRAQQQFAQALASLTRALDPSRPVVSNEGWEHVDSDLLGLHDYTTDPELLRARYADKQAAVDTVLAGHGPQGRRPIVSEAQVATFLAGKAPLMITEFGGISLTGGDRSDDDESWGYAEVGSASEYAKVLGQLFEALRASPEVAGFCYTQYMDTGQEVNGLVFADGTPKLPIESIFKIVTGTEAGGIDASESTFALAE